MEALVWLQFRAVWFIAIQFSSSCVKIRQPHIFKLQIEVKNLVLHSNKYGKSVMWDVTQCDVVDQYHCFVRDVLPVLSGLK